uniref:Fimbrial usher protein n=1 Tax=Strongyloides venezuelensis TaxID=75913 RepID=A0A0K0F2M1_STRVS
MNTKIVAFSIKRNFVLNAYRNGEYLNALPGQGLMSYEFQDYGVPVVDNSGKVTYGLRKKYDRNCFFSPVQCMTSFGNPSLDTQVGWARI